MPVRERGAPIRSLADDLRARSDEELAALMRVRPELARPTPSDMHTLAARATSAATVARALADLDQGATCVLEALTITGGNVSQAARMCAARPAQLRPIIDQLWERGLIWRNSSGAHVPAGVAHALGPYPGGLAPAEAAPNATDAPAPQLIADLLNGLSAPARGLIEALTWGPPIGEVSPNPGSALRQTIDQLIAQGLLRPVAPDRVLLPQHVALALRGYRIAPHDPLTPPEPHLVESRATAEAGALAAIAAVLERTDELGHRLGQEPAQMLRAGGIGVRELRRLSADLDIGRDEAVTCLEIAREAGLIGSIEDTSAGADTPPMRANRARVDQGELGYAPTGAYDSWRMASAPLRWARLALAWFETDRAISAVTADATGAPANALAKTPATVPGTRSAQLAPTPVPVYGQDATSAAMRAIRHETLDALAMAPAGSAMNQQDLSALTRWHHPRRDSQVRAAGIEAALAEGAALGVITQGALSHAGRALWAAWREGLRLDPGIDDPPVDAYPSAQAQLARLGEALPPAATQILLQTDLTATVPGRVEGALADLLRLAADLESRGGASVFRFSPASVRRYLDTGANADELLRALAQYSPLPVPQPLEYLIRDVARRHGRVRVGETSTILISDDVAALDAIEHDPPIAALGLRRLAPTVLTSITPRRTLVAALRKAGHTPLVEGPAGIGTARAYRPARSRDLHRRLPEQQPPPLTDEQLGNLIAALRASDSAASTTGQGPRMLATDPSITLDVLRHAVLTHAQVWIAVATAEGTTNKVLFRPTRVEAGRVHGQLDGQDTQRTFSIHRLIAAAPAATS